MTPNSPNDATPTAPRPVIPIAPPARPFSISPPRGRSCAADWLASLPPPRRNQLIRSLSPNALLAAPWLFELWGRADHQLEPPAAPGDAPWSTWAILGGRGSGKTRAGAEWVRAQVEGATPEAPGRCRRVALLAETADQARDVMVLGESGLLAVTPPDRRPLFQVSRRRLVWPNGAEAHLFSASDPEALRGPQFDLAWSDELAKWRRAEAAWDMLQFGLRLDDLDGGRPRQIVTTTPRRNPTLLRILEDPATAATTAPTRANAANLAADFLERVERRYRGATLGRQELDGELILDPPGGLWTRALIDAARAGYQPERAGQRQAWQRQAGQEQTGQGRRPSYDRIVVAVDPPVTAHQGSDACGIIVAGVHLGESWEDRRAAVLADCSVRGASPKRLGRPRRVSLSPVPGRPPRGRGQPGRRSGRNRDPSDRPQHRLPRRPRHPRQTCPRRTNRRPLYEQDQIPHHPAQPPASTCWKTRCAP